jgi:cytochrome c biogenesis protein CcdA
MGNGRDFIEGWLSPWSRNLMLALGYGLVVVSLFTIGNGLHSNNMRTIVTGIIVGFIGWLLSALMPDPIPAPRKSLRRRAAMLARVGGHQLPH